MTEIILWGEKSAGATIMTVETETRGKRRILWAASWFSGGASTRTYVQGLVDATECLLSDGWDYWERSQTSLQGCTPILTHVFESDKWVIGDLNIGQSIEIVDALILLGIIPADPEHEDRMDGWGGRGDVARMVACIAKTRNSVRKYLAKREGRTAL